MRFSSRIEDAFTESGYMMRESDTALNRNIQVLITFYHDRSGVS